MRALPVLGSGAPLHALTGAEHLAFVCNGCGDCCRRHRVALTHRDLGRLARALAVSPGTLVDWLPPDQVDLDAESASLALLPEGPRLMVLAHGARGCVFLDANDRCLAYDARPLDCRLYPFVLERNGDGRVTGVAHFEPNGCGDRGTERADIAALARADGERRAELAEHRSLLARWNQLARHRARFGHRAHGADELFAFLAANGAAGLTP